MAPILEMHDIEKTYPGVRALHQNPLARQAVERGPEMRPGRAAPENRVRPGLTQPRQ